MVEETFQLLCAVFIGDKEQRGGKIFYFGGFLKFLVGNPDEAIRFSFFEI